MLPSGENCGMVRGRKQVTDPMQYESIFPARFLARPNRFTALCRLEDGADIVCHVRNTGRCAELFRPGCRVWVQHNPSSTRKTAWTLITVDKDGGAGECGFAGAQQALCRGGDKGNSGAGLPEPGGTRCAPK